MTARYMYSTQHNSKAKHTYDSCSLACINPAQFAPYNRVLYGKSLCVVGISLACACSAVCVGLNSAAFADESVGQPSATTLDQQQTPKRTLTKEDVEAMAGCVATIDGDKLVIAPINHAADGVISKDLKSTDFDALRAVITSTAAQGKTLEFKGNIYGYGNISELFKESKISSLGNINRFDVSNVTDMSELFSGCTSLKGSLEPLASWDTSNVTNMKEMFALCKGITGSLTQLNSWNTSKVKNMGGMFFGCNSLSGVNDLSNWDISHVVDSPKGTTPTERYNESFGLKYMFAAYYDEATHKWYGVGNGNFVLNFSNKKFPDQVTTAKMFKYLRGTLVATNWQNYKLDHPFTSTDTLDFAKHGWTFADNHREDFTFVTDDTTGLADSDFVKEGSYKIVTYNVTVTYKTPDGKTCTKKIPLKYARALKKPGTNENKDDKFDSAEQEAYRTAAQAIVQYDIDGLKKQHPNWIITNKFHVGAQLPATLPTTIDEVEDITIDLGQITVNQERKPNLEPELTALYRLYNPYTHEHFFTAETVENDNLVRLGWKSEGGVGYVYKHGEKGGVYRLYNPTTGEHHYTMNEDEVATCVKAGWKSEGVKWFSAQDKEVTLNKLYSMYNPYEKKFYHHYTADAKEIEQMVKAGWRKEEVKWCTLPVSAVK